jgi:SAM-dependent methyltransferase
MDPKSRFSSRVENYIKYRPGYPAEIIETLRAECGLTEESRIADIGSGTGLLALRFLEAGCPVTGVEPNAAMRAAGEKLLAGYPNFTSLDGAAEATGLPSASVDFITAGQAYHWFDHAKTGVEFRRILQPGGWVALVWNERRLDSTPFLRAYEELLQTYATDYSQVNHRNVEEDAAALGVFFGGPYRVARFDNRQVFDHAGFQGRALSSSYIPEAGHPNYSALLIALRRLYDQYQQGGTVEVAYDTRMFYGRLKT